MTATHPIVTLAGEFASPRQEAKLKMQDAREWYVPFGVSLALAAATLALWTVQLEAEREARAENERHAAERIALEMRSELRSLVYALERMAARLPDTTSDSLSSWRRDAADYLDDFPGLLRLEVSPPPDAAWVLHSDEASETLLPLTGPAPGSATAPVVWVWPARDAPMFGIAVPLATGTSAAVRPSRLAATFASATAMARPLTLTGDRSARVVWRGQELYRTAAWTSDGHVTEAVTTDQMGGEVLVEIGPGIAHEGLPVSSLIFGAGMAIAVLVGGLLRFRYLADERARAAERERVTAERARSRLQTLFDSSRDVIYALAADGRISLLSLSFEKATGWARSDWLGRSFRDLIHPDDVPAASRRFAENLDGVVPRVHELRIRRRDGGYVTTEVAAGPLHVDGAIVGTLGTCRDCTRERMLERQLHHSRRLEALGQLAAGVAHDFNNILVAINGYTELILHDLPPDARHRDEVEEILAASRRGASLTRQLLTFGREQEGQPRAFDPDQALEDLSPMLRRLAGDEIDVRLDLRASRAEKPTKVRMDPTRFDQIAMNLFTNACEATPHGGLVELSTARVGPSDSSAGLTGSWFRLCVRDTGTGFDERTLPRALDPYFTTKDDGTGLGLALVAGIVAAAGGHVRLANRPDRGAVLEVDLPVESTDDDTAHEGPPTESFDHEVGPPGFEPGRNRL